MRDIVSTTSLRTAGSAGWARSTSTRASAIAGKVAAAGERALVDRAAVRMHREGVGEDQRGAALRRRRGASRSRPLRRARGRRCARGRRRARASPRGSPRHNRRASCLRARGRCRRSPDNRRRSRGASRRNARAADARPICPSRRRGGRRSASHRRRPLRHSRSSYPLLVMTRGMAASWQRRRRAALASRP